MQSQEAYLLTQDVVHTGLTAWAKLTSPVCTELVMEKSGFTLIINKNLELHLDTTTFENNNSLLEQVCAYSQIDIRRNVEQNSREKRTRSTYISCFC